MKRRLRHLSAGLSATLWAATLFAWAWSYFEPVDFSSGPVTGLVSMEVGVVACEGRAMAYFARGGFPNFTTLGLPHGGEVLFNLDRYYTVPQTPEAEWRAGPFAYWQAVDFGTRYRRVFTPLWFPLLAFSVLPAQWLRRHHKERQARRRLVDGACPACGYDLSGDSGQTDIRAIRCPECGRNPLQAYDAAI